LTSGGPIYRFRADQAGPPAAMSGAPLHHVMAKSDDQSEKAMSRLEARLDAFEAGRARPTSSPFALSGMGPGYRMVWEIVSGLFGGVALGWALDHFAGTAPWGVVGGLVIGSGVAVFLAARSAARMGAESLAKNPAEPVPFDDDED
jgi:ATP synthase protein I